MADWGSVCTIDVPHCEYCGATEITAKAVDTPIGQVTLASCSACGGPIVDAEHCMGGTDAGALGGHR